MIANLTPIVADAVNLNVLGKGLMVGLGFIGPSIGIGLIGGNYLQAVGRNP
jgi:F0F1-type ATP synthase membrane subunit c/vacuolar-type H+-ATPase subunit K